MEGGLWRVRSQVRLHKEIWMKIDKTKQTTQKHHNYVLSGLGVKNSQRLGNAEA